MGAAGVKFSRIRTGKAGDVSGIFDYRHLHAQTDAEIGKPLLPGILSRQDHALNSPAPKASRNQDAFQPCQLLSVIFPGDALRIDPFDFHLNLMIISRMAQGLRHGKVCIMQCHILAHQPNMHRAGANFAVLHHLPPLIQLELRRLDSQLPAYHLRKVRPLQHQGRFVQVRQSDVFNDTILLHITKQGNFAKNTLLQRLVTAKHNNVRIDPHPLQLLHGMLSGLGFVFIGAPQEGHQCHMNEQAVLPSRLQGNLPHRLYKGLGFNITDGAPDFGDYHVRLCLFSHTVDEILDLIGDMGNNLYGGSQILAPAFLVQHVPIYLSCGKVRKLIQIFVDKTLIMPQIQICLRAVLGHIHLPVLIRTHGAGIHIDIRIQLLSRHLQPSCLQQPPQGRRRDPLSQPRHNASRDKNILMHTLPIPFFYK